MVFSKKVIRVQTNLISVGMDYSINKIFSLYNIPFGLTIQNIMSYHPYEVAISIIALKLGITNKLLLSLILAFLL